MPNPALLIGGLSGLAGLLGRRKPYRYREPGPFSFTPDPNDPELGARRRMLLGDIDRDRSRTVNEIGRAGLLGSGKQFELMGEQERRGLSELEDIDADVFMKRRQEELQNYRDRLNFERRRALMADEAAYRESEMGLGALGDIGGLIGGGIDEYMSGGRRGYDYRNLVDPLLRDYGEYD